MPIIPIQSYLRKTDLRADRIPLALFCFFLVFLANPGLAQAPSKADEARQEAFTALSILQSTPLPINCLVLDPTNSDRAILALGNGIMKTYQFKSDQSKENVQSRASTGTKEIAETRENADKSKAWKFVAQAGDSSSHSVFCIALSTDGKVLAASRDNGTIDIFTLNRENWGKPTLITTERPAKSSKANDPALCLAFAPFSEPESGSTTYHIAVGWQSGGVSMVDFTPGRSLAYQDLLPAPYSHRSPTNSLAFSPDGKRLVSGSENGQLTLHNPHNVKDATELQGPTGSISSVAFDPKDSHRLYFTAPSDAVIFEENVDTKQVLQHKSKRGAITLAVGNNLLVTGYRDGSVRFDSLDGSRIASGSDKTEHKGTVLALAISPDGARLLSGDNTGMLLAWQSKRTN